MAKQFSLSIVFQAIDRLTSPIQKMGRSLRRLRNPIRRATQAMRRFGKAMLENSAKIRQVGQTLRNRLTLPILAFGALSIRTAVRFRAAMNFVRAVTGATGKDLKRLENTAKELGRTTQFSAIQAAKAMKFLGLAGLKVNEIMLALPKTLELAASAQLDLVSAANIVVGVVKGMELSFDNLGRINDVLVNAFTKSNTNLLELGAGMAKVGSVARTFGFGLEEIAASLGLLGERAMGGSLGGRALRVIIVKLSKDLSSKAKNAFEKFNIQVKDNTGNLKSMVEILKTFEDALARGANQVEVNNAVLEALGVRGGPAFLALLAAGSDRLAEFSKELEESGTASRIMKAQMEGLPGTFKRLISVFEALQLAITASGLGEFVGNLVDGLSNFIEALSRTNPRLLAFMTVILGVLAAIGPLVLISVLLAKTFAILAASPILLIFAKIAAVIAIATAAIVLFKDEFINAFKVIDKFLGLSKLGETLGAMAFSTRRLLFGLPGGGFAPTQTTAPAGIPITSGQGNQSNLDIRIRTDEGLVASTERVRTSPELGLSVATDLSRGPTLGGL